jgi:hypothetical protein
MADNHPSWAYQASEALTRIAKRFRVLIADRMRPLCEHDQAWTRLSAWAVRAEAGADEIDAETLLDVLDSLSQAMSANRNLGGGWTIHRHDGRRQLEGLALIVAARIAAERSQEEAAALFVRLMPVLEHASVWFYERLMVIMRTREITLPVPASWVRGVGRDFDIGRVAQFGQAQRAVFHTLLQTLRADLESEAAKLAQGQPLYHIAAFFAVIQLGQVGMSDLWGWLEAFELADIAEVYRGMATLAGLPIDELAREAALLQDSISESDSDRLSLVFDHVPHVDALELDTRRLEGIAIDFARVERAMHHPSTTVVMAAEELASRAGAPPLWRRMAASLFATGQGLALAAAASLASKLPLDEALTLLFSHATQPPRPGTAYVIETLAEICPDDDPRRQQSLRAALFGGRTRSAVAAANWAKARPNRRNPAEATLLQKAFDHWIGAEEPYPEAGGSIPHSPRAALVSALYEMRSLDLDTLLDWADDTRSDVTEAARAALIDLIGRDDVARARFVDLAVAGKIRAPNLRAALAEYRGYANGEIKRLLDLLKSSDAERRFVAMPLLDLPAVDAGQRAAALASLRDDVEPQIREKAVRMIG